MRLFTQEEFAAKLGIAQHTLSRYETGIITPPIDRQQEIATILGTSVETLWPEAAGVEAQGQ